MKNILQIFFGLVFVGACFESKSNVNDKGLSGASSVQNVVERQDPSVNSVNERVIPGEPATILVDTSSVAVEADAFSEPVFLSLTSVTEGNPVLLSYPELASANQAVIISAKYLNGDLVTREGLNSSLTVSFEVASIDGLEVKVKPSEETGFSNIDQAAINLASLPGDRHSVTVKVTVANVIVALYSNDPNVISASQDYISNIDQSGGNGSDQENSSSSGVLPVITAILPADGPASGGQNVTISGANFSSSDVITIGGLPCQNKVLLDPVTFSCDTPALSVGVQNVTITTQSGLYATFEAGFTTFESLRVDSVSPAITSIVGSQNITVSGAGFDELIVVTIGVDECSNVNLESSTRFKCLTPPSTTGKKSLKVSKPNGESVVKEDFIEYLPGPVITSISPNAGLVLGGNSVSFTGTDFSTEPGVKITFGDQDCVNLVVSSNSSASCVAPPGLGSVNVMITHPSGVSYTIKGGYTYYQGLTVTDVIPNEGSNAGGTPITINGTGFHSSVYVEIAGGSCRNLQILSTTQMTCETPAALPGATTINVSALTGNSSSSYTYLSTSGVLLSGTLIGGARTRDLEIKYLCRS